MAFFISTVECNIVDAKRGTKRTLGSVWKSWVLRLPLMIIVMQQKTVYLSIFLFDNAYYRHL